MTESFVGRLAREYSEAKGFELAVRSGEQLHKDYLAGKIGADRVREVFAKARETDLEEPLIGTFFALHAQT